MKFVVIALVLFVGATLPGFEVLGGQTDWYSRGIIRRQTINGMTSHPKKQQYRKQRKHKPRPASHRRSH